MAQHLCIAQCPARGDPLAQTRAGQATYLVDEAALPHPLDAPLDALVEDGTRHSQPDLHRIDRCIARHAQTERSSGQLHHLEGPHDAPQVARLDRRRGLRIARGETSVQRSGPVLFLLALESRPQRWVGARER